MTTPADPRFVRATPGHPLDLTEMLRSAYSAANDEWNARFGFAYVSASGLDAFLGTLSAIAAWPRTRKEWIVGLHHGISEPVAIQRIRDLDGSEVRVFVGADRLSAESLVTGRLFHAKVLSVTHGRLRKPACLIASSANLTGAAMGVGARNFEAGIALPATLVPTEVQSAFDAWWEDAWQVSLAVTDALLQRYTELRERFLKRNPDTLVDLDPPSPSRLESAPALWIEAGAMSGGSRNQVEFNHALAGFFGPISARSRDLRIKIGRRVWDERPLSPKTTSFGVDIWRLSLPTEATGGFAYPGRVIRFEKHTEGRALYFEVDVTDIDSSKDRRWRATAHRHGYVGGTSGQRAYGFEGENHG